MKFQSFKVLLLSALVLVASQLSFAGAIDGKKFKDWQGRCQVDSGKETCYIIQMLLVDNKEPLMITTVNLVQHPKYPVITLRVPAVLDTTKDVAFKVDKNSPIGLKSQCSEKECGVSFALDKRMLDEFKRGRQGVLAFITKDSGKPVYYPVSLSGITKALAELKKS